MKLFALCAVLAFAFSITACVWENSNHERFASHLQGTWVSHEQHDIYSGTLVITFNSITITGFYPSQTPPAGCPYLGNDFYRPFRDFTKNTALRGYSEEGQRVGMSIVGHIFIWDIGTLQAPLFYTYWWNGVPFAGREHFLSFTFNNKTHTFRRN